MDQGILMCHLKHLMSLWKQRLAHFRAFLLLSYFVPISDRKLLLFQSLLTFMEEVHPVQTDSDEIQLSE